MSIDGGQEGQFLKPFEPVIPDVLADNGSVFLLDETVVVLFVVTAAGEGEGFLFTPYFGGVIDKFRAIITVDSKTGKGTVFLISERALNVQEWALLRRERSSVQPEATSVAVKVWTYWPVVACPQW